MHYHEASEQFAYVFPTCSPTLWGSGSWVSVWLLKFILSWYSFSCLHLVTQSFLMYSTYFSCLSHQREIHNEVQWSPLEALDIKTWICEKVRMFKIYYQFTSQRRALLATNSCSSSVFSYWYKIVISHSYCSVLPTPDFSFTKNFKSKRKIQ